MILFISLLTLILCFLNYYFLYPMDQKLFFVYAFISILIFIIACICIISKKQKNKKNKAIIQEIEKYFSLSKSNSLEELKENLKLSFDLTGKKLHEQKKQNLYLERNYQYLTHGLGYLYLDNSTYILKPFTKDYKSDLEHRHFKNIHVGIINNNKNENFLLQSILLKMNISSEILYKYNQKDDKNYSFIISKEKIHNVLNFTFEEIHIEKIVGFLNTHFTQEHYIIRDCYNVLIFKSSYFENNLILNITNQFCSHNQTMDNLSDFKKALQFKFKLILVDYEVIKFDLMHTSQILQEYKIKNPQIVILLFSKNRVKDCNFANLILSDINKSEWLALLKKYINQSLVL
ncbi:hypothetical protein CSUB8523_0518 [Campylobacter subantarcticus LMG 24377]|uniref:Response regulatory domain-containing protein n=1 Tax=Campylobacter subantarcticus TaxID=497724 RepID=A0ABW9N4W6_9BACT|nr:hypothetical protein [Campylobacter subantarcticus]AJC92065.1 hypothetical protein CSUB8523_0518 [Campylobacter subantarcticus LMG 24377]EAL3939652.1 hypothetical protein [Campylobacter lari]MPB99329.1 hypothetical protein [Campylobacter subantarcticus]